MSVSDPLLKQLKVFIYKLRTDPDPIKDDHPALRSLSETLEHVLRKGLRQTNSIFGLSRRDYWHWVEHVADDRNTAASGSPFFTMAFDQAKNCRQVMTSQGRGRMFLRCAMQKKALGQTFQQLILCYKGVEVIYDPLMSILADEILREIFMSLIDQVHEVNFELDLNNCSFLDQTWQMPIHKQILLVPTKDLGLQVLHYGTRVMVAGLDGRGVAFDSGEFDVGDVLDSIQGEPLRYIQKGRIQSILRNNKGVPVHLNFTKSRLADGSLFPPIADLLRKSKKEEKSSQGDADKAKSDGKVPAHALLPEEDMDEIPVHNTDDKAVYEMQYIGKIIVGPNGGVNQIEGAIGNLLNVVNPDKNPDALKPILLELGETDVIITDPDTKEVIYKHSYTEISACGRRIDMLQYIAYLAGETTCTLAKEFVAYVFQPANPTEGKHVLCSIAQGFSRTHWFV